MRSIPNNVIFPQNLGNFDPGTHGPNKCEFSDLDLDNFSMEKSVNIKSNASLIVLLTTLVLTSSCSKEEEKEEAKPAENATTNPDTSANNVQPAPNTTALPPNHPVPETMLPQNMSPQATAPPPANPGQAEVLKAMHASGYTYMEVDLGDRKTWVAATSMKIKAGETLKWESAAVMRNFTSKALRRTFEEVLFVSDATNASIASAATNVPDAPAVDTSAEK